MPWRPQPAEQGASRRNEGRQAFREKAGTVTTAWFQGRRRLWREAQDLCRLSDSVRLANRTGGGWRIQRSAGSADAAY